MELRFRIPIVSGILESLSCSPDSKTQDSGFQSTISRILVHGAQNSGKLSILSKRRESCVGEKMIYSYYYLHSMVGRTLRCQHLFSFLMSNAEPNKKVMRNKISIPFIYLQHSPHCMHNRELKQRRQRQRERQETIGLR